MIRARPRLSAPRSLALLLFLAWAPGCGARAAAPAHAPLGGKGVVHPLGVTGETFGPELVVLFGSGEASATRQDRLIGVVRHQLGRAEELFENGHDEAGRGAVAAALGLVRAGEFHPSMLEGRTAPLALGASAVARQGSDGRAFALYSMLDRVLPRGPEHDEISAHLAAIRAWQAGTRSQGPLQAASNDSASAIDRALWDPENETLRMARAATIEWIDRAIGYGKEQMPPKNEFEQNEAIEAYRAIRIGAMELAALYLRNGNAAGALEAMETPHVARVVSPHLHDALKRAKDDNDPEAWLELFSTFDRLGSADSDVSLDLDLAQAAAWGAALELYRAEPKTMRGAMPVATLAMRRGLGEVGPLLMRPIVEATARVEIASWTLGYVLETLMGHAAVSDVAAARRTFQNALPLFALIEKQSFAKDVTPSVARVRYAMGALEARAGDLTRARPLVEAAAKSEPTLPALELLAAIDRQRGAARQAVLWLEAVEKFATEASDPTAVADARLATFEVYRDEGNGAEAAKALEAALRRALDAKKLARTGPEQAGAERVLARVLEQYGSLDGARRATLRAFEASRSDLRQLTATVLDAGRRGLTRGDLRTVRDATRRALDANLASDDLVYVALWLRLLERRLGKPSDGTVEEAFAKIDDDDGWPAKLRSWGQGRLTDEQLVTAAKGRVEQSEASFYTAMAAFVVNDTRAAERIERFAKSESIELVEVAIARDLAAEKKRLDLKLPKDVDVP
jgi:tetratricopeptide (TPR) repeat protein